MYVGEFLFLKLELNLEINNAKVEVILFICIWNKYILMSRQHLST